MHANRRQAGFRGECERFATRSALLGALLLTLLAGCATKPPPTLSEIREQSGTLATMPLANPWKAGASAGPIADDWLGSSGRSSVS